MTVTQDHPALTPALSRYIYLTGTKLGELDEEDLPGYQEELAELVRLATPTIPEPGRTTPELTRAARALYLADHAHNPYAAGDWDASSPFNAEHRRYIGLARTTITAYQQECQK